MSVNCIQCVKNKRTGPDLLCDECRAASSLAAQAREIVIFGCECEGFRQGNGIWFDSQDSEELGWTECPCCHKPFKHEAQHNGPV